MAAFSQEEITDIIIDDVGMSFNISPTGLAFLNHEISIRHDLKGLPRDEIIDWLVKIISNIPNSYPTTEGEIEYENLTLTPWELFRAMTEMDLENMSEDESGEGDDDEFIPIQPVTYILDGHVFTQRMNMDYAMGLYLFAKVSGMNLQMSMYDTPLTYFIQGQDDIYFRYNDHATEDENYLQMAGSQRKYFFFGEDFLKAMADLAPRLGLNVHDYVISAKTAAGDDIQF